jgi:hypothetical protein
MERVDGGFRVECQGWRGSVRALCSRGKDVVCVLLCGADGVCVCMCVRCTYLNIQKIIPLPQIPLLEIYLQYPVRTEKLAKASDAIERAIQARPLSTISTHPASTTRKPPHLQDRSRTRSLCLSQNPHLARYYSNYPHHPLTPKLQTKTSEHLDPSGASTPRARDQNPESPHPFVHHNARAEQKTGLYKRQTPQYMQNTIHCLSIIA